MQAFYNQLIAQEHHNTDYWKWLTQLTRASLSQLAALNSNMGWQPW